MMLSGEAAIGAHPVETVQMMASCVRTAEQTKGLVTAPVTTDHPMAMVMPSPMALPSHQIAYVARACNNEYRGAQQSGCDRGQSLALSPRGYNSGHSSAPLACSGITL